MRHYFYVKGKPICARIKLKPMIRLPAGATAGTTAGGTTVTNTPTVNAAQSPITSATGNQPMQSGIPTGTSNAQSPTVGVQIFAGSNAVSSAVPVSSTGVTVAVSGSSQAIQQPGNSISGTTSSASKNAFNRPAPSPVQAQQQINIAPSTTPGKPVVFAL